VVGDSLTLATKISWSVELVWKGRTIMPIGAKKRDITEMKGNNARKRIGLTDIRIRNHKSVPAI
jgi:hypothetical protein